MSDIDSAAGSFAHDVDGMLPKIGNPPGDEAIIVHLIESVLTGRPDYAANLLTFFGRGDYESCEPLAPKAKDNTALDLKQLYRRSRLPPRLMPLFEVAIDIGMEIYRDNGGPFDDTETREAVRRFIDRFLDHREDISLGMWRSILSLIVRRS